MIVFLFYITAAILSKPLDKKRANELRSAAAKTLRELKNTRANIRVSENDLDEIRRLAEQAGMPYQTLITHILHLYVTNQLVSVQEIKKLAAAGVFDHLKAG